MPTSSPQLSTDKSSRDARWRIEPLWIGLAGGVISSIGYTAANICLRSVTQVDPIWVSCVKAFPTVVLVGPWLLVRASKGQHILPGPRSFWLLVLAAFLGQVAGNVVFQWGLGVIGIALTVPLTLGTLIVGGAALGWMFLKEAVTLRSAISIAVLILAMCVLSLGAKDASAAIAGLQEISTWKIAAGVAAACMAGASYAFLGVVIRYGVIDRTPVSTTLFVVGVVGLVVLGAMTWQQIGIEGILATTPTNQAFMLLAGVFNLIAFLALTLSLQSLNVVIVNALNATQAAMAAVAGVLIFGEPLSAALGLGVSLTALGLIIMRRKRVPGSEEGLPMTLPEDEQQEPACVAGQFVGDDR